MDYIRRRLQHAITEEIDSRTRLLRTVTVADLQSAQGFISGLEKGLRILNDQFDRIESVDA